MKRHPLAAFFALSVVISWFFWLVVVGGVRGWFTPPISGRTLIWLGACGPTAAAVIVTLMVAHMEGLKRVFQRFLIWRVGVIWYVVALFLPAVISLLSTALHMAFGGDAPDFSNPPIYRIPLTGFYGEYNAWTILVPLFLQHLISDTALAEEFAWRGFALPRLQRVFSAWLAAVIIGLMVVLWQLPLSVFSPEGFAARPFLLAVLGTVAQAILAAWLFNNARGSLILVVLFNNSIKVTDLFVASPQDNPLMPVVSFWIVAACVLVATKPATLTRGPIAAQALAEDEASAPVRT